MHGVEHLTYPLLSGLVPVIDFSHFESRQSIDSIGYFSSLGHQNFTRLSIDVLPLQSKWQLIAFERQMHSHVSSPFATPCDLPPLTNG